MRTYTKFSPRFWTGTLGRTLRGNPELTALACYLATSPHQTLVGIYRLPIPYAVADLGLSEKVVRDGLARLEEIGYIRHDENRQLLWVVEHARHEFGTRAGGAVKANERQAVAVARLIDEVKASPLAGEFAKRYPQLFPKAYPLDTLCHTLPIPRRSQEQEQEQEQEPTASCAEPDKPAPAPPPVEPVLSFPVTGNGAGGGEWGLDPDKLREYVETYPEAGETAVLAALRSARQWCRDNPAKRKTPRGMPRFLTNWLSRAQNRGELAGDGRGRSGPRTSTGGRWPYTDAAADFD